MRKLAPAIMIAALALGSVGARAEGPVIIPVQQGGAAPTEADGVAAGKLTYVAGNTNAEAE